MANDFAREFSRLVDNLSNWADFAKLLVRVLIWVSSYNTRLRFFSVARFHFFDCGSCVRDCTTTAVHYNIIIPMDTAAL